MTTQFTVPELLEQNAETYRQKNEDYGDSWRTAGKIIELWMNQSGVDELVIPADESVINSLLMWGRRLDKDTRGFNGEFLADELNFESTEDAHLDNGNYSTMHAKLLMDRRSRNQQEACLATDGGEEQPEEFDEYAAMRDSMLDR